MTDKEQLVKEALFEDLDFWSGKRMSGMDPRTWIPSLGKSEKASNSPSYRSAVRIMDKIDKEVRRTFEKQKKLIPVLRWSKFKMNLSKFAHAADAFLKYQIYMDTLLTNNDITKGLESLMNQFILDVYGRNAAPDFERINPSEVLSQIGGQIDGLKADFQSPDLDWKTYGEAKPGQPSASSETAAQSQPAAQKAASLNQELRKEALLGWLHKLPEMQSLAQNIKDLYNEIYDMYQRNKLNLKTLAKAYNSGSVQRFTEAAKDFHNDTSWAVKNARKLFDSRLSHIIEQHRQRLKVQEEKERELQQERESAAVATDEGKSVEEQGQQTPPKTVVAPLAEAQPQPAPKPEPEPAAEPAAKPVAEPEPEKQKKEFPEPSFEEVPGSEFEEFQPPAAQTKTTMVKLINRIEKIATITGDPYRVAYELLHVASQIESDDIELANKLTAIAEEAFDE